MNEIDVDKNCAVTEVLDPWGPQPPTYDNIPDVAQPDVLKECSAPYEVCGEGSAAAGCFVVFYVFNEERRNAMRACFGLTCVAMNDCMDDNHPVGYPWVTIPPHDGSL